MESCNNQYINKRNNDLYIYSNSRTMCNDGKNGCSNHKSNYTSLHTDRTIMSELNITRPPTSINQWHYTTIYSSNNQYINKRNNDLYIYSNIRTVRNDS